MALQHTSMINAKYHLLGRELREQQQSSFEGGIVEPTWDGDLLHLNFWLNMVLIAIYVLRSMIAPRILEWGGAAFPADSSPEMKRIRVSYNKCTFYVVEIAMQTLVLALSVAMGLWSVVLDPHQYELGSSSATATADDYRQLQIGFVVIWNIVIMTHFLEILFLESDLRLELQVHHWALIVLGNINYWAIVDDSSDVNLYRLIFMFTVYEMAELPTYVSLLVYRLENLRVPSMFYWITAVWYGLSRFVVFAIIWVLWEDYRKGLKENTAWSTLTLILDSTANVVALVTGMVAFKAQIVMAQRSNNTLKNEEMKEEEEVPSIASNNKESTDESKKESADRHGTPSTSSDLEGGKIGVDVSN